MVKDMEKPDTVQPAVGGKAAGTGENGRAGKTAGAGESGRTGVKTAGAGESGRKANTEEAILQAAVKLFAEKGFKGATTTLIAAEAGVTHAMLHYYFRSKEQIFIRVFEEYIRDIKKSLKPVMVRETGISEVIENAVRTAFDFFRSHSGQVNLFLEVAHDNPEMLKKGAADIYAFATDYIGPHARRFSKAAEAGVISDVGFPTILMDILQVSATSVLLIPRFAKVLDLKENEVEALYENRRAEAVELIRRRLVPAGGKML